MNLEGRHIRKLTRTTLAVIALILGAVSINASAQDSTPEPNALGPVPAPDTYQAFWDLVQVRYELVKVGGMWRDVNEVTTGFGLVPQQSIAISGDLVFEKASHVIGVEVGSLLVRRALDDQGRPVTLRSSVYASWPRLAAPRNYAQLLYWRSISPWSFFLPSLDGSEGSAGALESTGFSVQLDLAADQNVPASLSLVECQAFVLCARSYLEADVPFAASSTWHEPMPGLHIRVLDVYVELSEYGFSTESCCDRGQVRCFPQSQPFEWAREPILSWPRSISTMDMVWLDAVGARQNGDALVPAYIVLDTQLLDPNGKPYLIRLGHEMRSDYRDTAAYCDCAVLDFSRQTPQTIRHIFAVEPYEAKILIALRDVPVVQEETEPQPEKSGRSR
jgi:hypothetical protein